MLRVKGIQITGERSFGRGAVVGKILIDDCSCRGTDKSFKENLIRHVRSRCEIYQRHRCSHAGTVGDRSLGYPDAGAHGLAVI